MTTYAYNKRRLLTSENVQYTGINWTTSYAYSALGDAASVTYPDGHTVSFAPNALGQPTQAGTYATGVTYHPNGAVKGFTYGNGIVHSLTLNTRQLPLKSRDAGSTTIIEDDYVYDFNGNIAAITDAVLGSTNGVREMAYDGLDRLVSVDASGAYGGDGAWQYDPLDNLRVAVQGSRDLRYNYNANWQLATLKNPAGTTLNTFIHDVRGNMLQRNTGDTFTFDRANRMTASSVGNGSYLYDALGRRVRRTVAGHTTNYQYSRSGQLMYAKSSSEGKLHNYIYLSGSMVAERSVPIGGGAAATLYQHSDGLGSAVAETNSVGTLNAPRELYTAYGESADGSMTEGHGYTGHQSDASVSLIYMQQRYYDPVIARFLSSDPAPVGPIGENFNRNWYADNSPFNFIDPDGRKSVSAADGAPEYPVEEAPPPPPTLPTVEVTAQRVSFPGAIPMPRPDRLPKITIRTPAWVKGVLRRPPNPLLLLVWPSEIGAAPCEVPPYPACGMMNEAEDESDQPNENDLVKIGSNEEADEVAREHGYDDAHDAKYKVGGSRVNIYRDRKTGDVWIWSGKKGDTKNRP